MQKNSTNVHLKYILMILFISLINLFIIYLQ